MFKKIKETVSFRLACGAAFALALTLPATAHGGGGVSFLDVTEFSGIRYTAEAETVVPIGSGTVWGDFDMDGWEDVYMLRANGCNHLFLNLGDGTFIESLGAAGANDCAGTSHGGSAADYDRDGDLDLYVTNNGQNRLFRNLLLERGGELTFRDATDDAGMMGDGEKNSSSSTWGDYDEDGYPDLFVANHFTTMEPLECNPDLLWHNNGDGTFSDVAATVGNIAKSGVLNIDGCGLAATWSDYDRDGDVDLLVVNDLGNLAATNRLFRNDGPGTGIGTWEFTDVSAESGFDYPMFGMGIATGDIDQDGYLDYYMTDIGPNNLARNKGDGTFEEIAEAAGVLADDFELFGGNGLVSWGPAFFDADHDGELDLFVANGGAPQYKFPDLFGEDYIDTNPNYTYRNEGDTTFTENHDQLGVEIQAYNRNITYCDYDHDGDLDLHIGNLEGLNTLYRNDRPNDDGWVKFDIDGTIGNLDGYGTFVTVEAGQRAQVREVDGGSSFLSRNSPIVHFGMSSLPTVKKAIFEFPVGVQSASLRHELRDLPVKRTYRITEPIYVVEPERLLIDDAVRGEPLELEFTTTNRTDEMGFYYLWINGVRRNGSEFRYIGPLQIQLEGGASQTRSITLPISESLPAGEYGIVFRTGSGPEPEQLIHQIYTNIVIID